MTLILSIVVIIVAREVWLGWPRTISIKPRSDYGARVRSVKP